MNFRVSRLAADSLVEECRRAADSVDQSNPELHETISRAAAMLEDLVAERDDCSSLARSAMEACAEMIEAEATIWPEDMERLRALARKVRDRAAQIPV